MPHHLVVEPFQKNKNSLNKEQLTKTERLKNIQAIQSFDLE